MNKTPWNADSLPLCEKLRPAIRVPYPYNGATCIEKQTRDEGKLEEEHIADQEAEKKEAEPASAKKEPAKEAAKEAAKEEKKEEKKEAKDAGAKKAA